MELTGKEKTMWKSVEEQKRSKYESSDIDVAKKEFSSEMKSILEKGANYSLDRKKFLTIMGASMSVAGLQCAREPVEKIVPYLVRPPEAQPGIPFYYASAKVDSRGVLPIMVKVREGKPIKIDGHDEHPVSKGAMTADGFASIWDLYDADRLRTSKIKEGDAQKDSSTEDAVAAAVEAISDAKSVRVLSAPSFSPSERQAVQNFLKSTSAKQVVYDNIGNLQSILEGEARSYGKGVVPLYRFDVADLIVSLEADFLGAWVAPELFTKQFSSRRDPDGKMNRLIAAESMMSVTGANADERVAIHAGSQKNLALGLIKLLLPGSSYAGNGAIRAAVKGHTPEAVSAATGVSAEKIKAIAAELKKRRGKSLVVAGGSSSRSADGGDMVVLANVINAILGNDGKTIQADTPIKAENDISSHRELSRLIADLNSEKVDLLILDRVNPVFDLPKNSGIAEAISKAGKVIALSERVDESSAQADILIATSHFMESWNDGESAGVYNVGQPSITPLFDTVSAGDAWLKLTKNDTSYHEFIRQNGANLRLTGVFEAAWEKAVYNGFFRFKKGGATGGRRFNASAVGSVKKAGVEKSGSFTLNLFESVGVRDGRNGNNSFRHEFPDPITKIAWDNYVAISPSDADENHWRMGDVLKVSRGSESIDLPLFIQPGLRKGSVAIAVGYGHETFGRVADGLGKNAMALADFNKSGISFSGLGVELKKVGDGYRIATTQRHHNMEGRYLARYATLDEYKRDPKAGHHELPLVGKGLYPPHDYSLEKDTPIYKWGMSVDLNKCTGCSACVLSCYSENNIPSTSRDEVWRGREMSWMRIDRYYEGDLEDPTTHFQPLMCQHCEAAPCENVCPVIATVHSPEGLNDMAYNRCIGTRYCSANCPYKVRRFNWFENWYGKVEHPQQMALNPDVTVRGRGVIEKCSMCVQRINEQRQMAHVEGRKIREEELKTACQQGCPADAIAFGDLGDKATKAAKLVADERSYTILAEVNTKPRINYMTRIINKG